VNLTDVIAAGPELQERDGGRRHGLYDEVDAAPRAGGE